MDYFSDCRYRFPAAGNQLKKSRNRFASRENYLFKQAGWYETETDDCGDIDDYQKSYIFRKYLEVGKIRYSRFFKLFVTK